MTHSYNLAVFLRNFSDSDAANITLRQRTLDNPYAVGAKPSRIRLFSCDLLLPINRLPNGNRNPNGSLGVGHLSALRLEIVFCCLRGEHDASRERREGP